MTVSSLRIRPSTPRAARPASGPWLVLVLVALAQFMVVLDATIVNVALPSIQRGLKMSSTDLQWVVNAYTLAFGGFLLLGGRAADIFGRKRLFLIGIAVFSAASLLDGLATSSAMLVIGRALQGFGGALVAPAALSILTTTFAEGRERTRALGVWSAVAIGGGAVGLLLGGLLTDLVSWQWVFYVNVPVGAATLLLSARYVPESRAPGVSRDIDYGGALTVTAGLLIAVYAIVNAQSAGWISAQTLSFGAVAVALLGSFVLIETRHKSPLIRLGILRVRSLASADLVMLVVAAGMFGMFYFASLYVQGVLNFTPLQAGLAFLPVTLGIVAGAGLSQQLIARFGVRATAILGMSLAAIGLLILSRIPVQGSYLADLLPGLMVMAFGMGLTFVPLTLIATTNVSAEDAGLASGLLNSAQQVGGALGLAIMATLAVDRATNNITALGHAPSTADRIAATVSGYQLAFLVAAGLIASGVVFMIAMLRRSDVERIDAMEEEVPTAIAV
ncbi:MAG TPA: MFS transporter [Candidatus Dormibacteraeota bacterium]|jgi:EmrB/QacA subfamily drug resistance transporter|nr:MFS transporter [Candidatus Dormibacteraeota bacterium]